MGKHKKIIIIIMEKKKKSKQNLEWGKEKSGKASTEAN